VPPFVEKNKNQGFMRRNYGGFGPVVDGKALPNNPFDPSAPMTGFTASIPVINTHRFDTITIGMSANPMNPWTLASSCSSITFQNMTSDLTQCKVTSIKVDGVEDKSNWKVFYYQGGYTGMKFSRTPSYSNTVGTTASLEMTFSAGAFTTPASGSATFKMDIWKDGGSGTDAGTAAFTLTGQSSGGSSGGSSPAPSTSATPDKGTAAALATIPKTSKAPKLTFDSSGNGLGKSSKKSLKKVADIAKDGYAVRVTGAAGMQPGVSKDAVKALAKKRAMEIRAYLIKQGVPKEDIIIKTKIFPIGKAPSTLVKVETIS
jgi:outer membrane protein OmpA-like peptidoglycan-associated protein